MAFLGEIGEIAENFEIGEGAAGAAGGFGEGAGAAAGELGLVDGLGEPVDVALAAELDTLLVDPDEVLQDPGSVDGDPYTDPNMFGGDSDPYYSDPDAPGEPGRRENPTPFSSEPGK